MGVVGDGSSCLFFFPDGPRIIKMDHVSCPAQPLGLPYFWRRGCQSLVSDTPTASCLSPTFTQAPRGDLLEVCLGPACCLPQDDAGRCSASLGHAWVRRSGHLGVRLPSEASAHGPLVPKWCEIQGFEWMGEAVKMPTGLARLLGKARNRCVIQVLNRLCFPPLHSAHHTWHL